MSLVNSPPTTQVDSQDANGRLLPPSEGWRAFFNALYQICNAMTMSGTTAQRPTRLLWIGRPFFDVTLTRPIWISQVTPAVVWIRADGVVV